MGWGVFLNNHSVDNLFLNLVITTVKDAALKKRSSIPLSPPAWKPYGLEAEPEADTSRI
jgi:hypothetical protein